MRLFRRKAHKRDLVIPAPVLGPTTIPQQMAAGKVAESLDDSFLWGDASPGSSKQMMISLPRDIRSLCAMYQGQRAPREGEYRPTVTYDPAGAQEALLYACKMPRPDGKREARHGSK